MTDKPRILGTGRLYFNGGIIPPGRPLDGFNRYTGRMSFEIVMPRFRQAQLAQEFFERDPIPYLVGYNPQKLLPAPGSDPSWFRRDFLAFFAAQLGTPYMTENIFKPSDFRAEAEYIDFDQHSPTGRSIDFRKLYPETTWRYKRAVLVVNADYGDLEARILAAYATPGVVAIELDMREARGEIYGPYGIYERPFVPEKKPLKQNGRPASYLDHDPSKKHGRKRR